MSEKSVTFAGGNENTMIMATIQDIQAFENQIYDAVQEYLDNKAAYFTPMLVVKREGGELNVCVEDTDCIVEGDNNIEMYFMDSLVREGDDGEEPDVDKINEIANSWLFLD